MPENSSYDLIQVLKHLTAMLEPIARSQGVHLYYEDTQKILRIRQPTDYLITGLTDLLFKLIHYTPSNNEISITIENKKEEDGSFLRILIANTGINLSRVTELTHHAKFAVQESSSRKGGTRFKIDFPIEPAPLEATPVNAEAVPPMPAFYAEVRKRFMLHFSKAEQLVATLSSFNPREATFLRKVNALIIENIGNPQLDANFISEAMHMSRTQLFRRLKPIIRQSPGSYIKTLKLQKAKELFQTTDLRINEVAYKTGFESPSHFTKSFVRHFGVKPSLFCRNKMQQMSK